MKQSIYLNTDREMPLLGLGVYKALGEGEAEHAITSAVKAGYRLIDTASVYKNESNVGRGVQSCRIPRKDLFVTTKVWNNAQRMNDVQDAFNRSLERLRMDYVDLYLIHWPVPGCYQSTWKEMEKIYESGRARSVGVSNFNIHNLQALEEISDLVPAVNQIECHPLCYPKALIDYCQSKGIVVQAYAPLARGAYMDHDVMCILATKYGRTPAQIGLRWMVQKNISVIPKSVHEERIISNSRIFDFEIAEEDMAILDTLNEDFHSSHVPDDLKGLIL